MTRIVTTHYRYKPPPRKRKAAPLAGPPVVTPKRKPAVAKKPEPAAAVVRKAKPCNDNRPEPEPEHLPNAGKNPAIVTARKPGKRYADVPDLTPEEHQRRSDAAAALWRGLVGQATAKDGGAAVSAESSSPATKPAIVTTSRQRRRSDGPPLPMELPLSRKPVERDGGDYKRLKAAMTRRLRGETK